MNNIIKLFRLPGSDDRRRLENVIVSAWSSVYQGCLRPFSVPAPLSVLCSLFECHYDFPNYVASEFFFSLLLLYLSLCLRQFHVKSRRASKHNQLIDVSFDKLRSVFASFHSLFSPLVTLSSQLIFFSLSESMSMSLLHRPILLHSRLSNSFIFFSSKFFLPGSNFFSSLNTFSATESNSDEICLLSISIQKSWLCFHGKGLHFGGS